MNYPTTFILGADSSVNDFPELYRNGPLLPNTEYTAFVWAFVPSVLVSVHTVVNPRRACAVRVTVVVLCVCVCVSVFSILPSRAWQLLQHGMGS